MEFKLFIDYVNDYYAANYVGPAVPELHYDKPCKKGPGHASISIGKHYNGSGPSAFDGVKEWSHVGMSISVPIDTTNENGQQLIADLQEVLNRHGYIKKG